MSISSNKWRSYIISFTVVIILLFSIYWIPSNIKSHSGLVKPGEILNVYFLNVGQGDSCFIITPAGQTVLIDGGDRDHAANIIRYIKSKGIKSIDLVISTHPHEDHIGGLVPILQALNVKKVIDSGYPHTSNIYKNYLQLINDKNIVYEVSQNQIIYLDHQVKIKIITSPIEPDSVNNSSIVAKLEYKRVSFLFTGDIGFTTEKKLLSFDLKVKILKVAHHGSSSSTSLEFLNRASPEVAIISSGQSNPYGLPHKATLENLKKQGIKIYRTDLNGNINISTNGNTYNVKTEH